MRSVSATAVVLKCTDTTARTPQRRCTQTDTVKLLYSALYTRLRIRRAMRICIHRDERDRDLHAGEYDRWNNCILSIHSVTRSVCSLVHVFLCVCLSVVFPCPGDRYKNKTPSQRGGEVAYSQAYCLYLEGIERGAVTAKHE